MISSGRGKSILAAALMACVGANVGHLNMAPPPHIGGGYFGRGRSTGRHNPAGSKLARKAKRGQIGIRKGW